MKDLEKLQKVLEDTLDYLKLVDKGTYGNSIMSDLIYAKSIVKNLSIDGVVRSKDVQLMRDSMLKSREETAKAREYSAIKQTLDIYCNDDELPTVNEVLERIGRKH